MSAKHDAGWMRRRRKVPDVIRRGLRLSIGLAICNSLGFLLADSVAGEHVFLVSNAASAVGGPCQLKFEEWRTKEQTMLRC